MLECKVKNARKHLWRVGELLRPLALLNAELLQQDMSEETGYVPKRPIAWEKHFSLPAVMHTLVKAALKGTGIEYQEVMVILKSPLFNDSTDIANEPESVESKSGVVYRLILPDSSSLAFDLAITSDSHQPTVIPWTDFEDRHVANVVESHGAGYLSGAFKTQLLSDATECKHNAIMSTPQLVTFLISRHESNMHIAFEEAARAVRNMTVRDLSSMIRLPRAEFEVAHRTFARKFTEKAREYNQMVKQEGSLLDWLNSLLARMDDIV
nr:hypothetical protein B0A51_00722 [Rachicladosporium sp. CCFEE 5018]